MNLRDIKLKELLRFLVGGGSAVIVDYLVLQGLMLLGLSLSPAKAVSFVCGAAVGFVINKLWTFERKKFSRTEILRYVILYTCTALINTGVNAAVFHLLGNVTFAFLCATGTSTVLNFLGQKFFVFR